MLLGNHRALRTCTVAAAARPRENVVVAPQAAGCLITLVAARWTSRENFSSSRKEQLIVRYCPGPYA